MEQKRFDFDGSEVITTALRELINLYPALPTGEAITFSTLNAESGIAMFPTSGAVIQREMESITGHVVQTCSYPFYILYRAGGLKENRKANVKEWLDNLGRWLERQEVEVSGEKHKLSRYPLLEGDRAFERIYRQSPAHLMSTYEDQVEDWAIYINAVYTNEFDK